MGTADIRRNAVLRAITVPLMLPMIATGGSINDDSPSSANAGCDKRVELKLAAVPGFCTDARKTEIGERCFVVIHQTPLEGRRCSWQGCGDFSLVGKPAVKDGADFIEYGVRTPSRGANAVQVGNGWLPQHPFPRHYMKVQDVAKLRRGACKTGETVNIPDAVKAKICSADITAINLNPYWLCYFGAN
ncbi:MAG: hypothetical protein RLZZ488_1220 [Pseudomonadota bacterium]|jgi:hypothetical protein